MNINKKLLARVLLLAVLFTVVFPGPGSFAANYPSIIISSPADNSIVNVNFVNIKGYVTDTSTLTINGGGVTFNASGFFSYIVPNLFEGSNTIRLTATGPSGLKTTRTITVVYHPDAVVPIFTVGTVNSEVYSEAITITGYVYSDLLGPIDFLNVSVNGIFRAEDELTNVSGNFVFPNIRLSPGDNIIDINAYDSGVLLTKTLHVRYNDQGEGKPNIYNLLPLSGTTVTTGTINVTGTVGNTVTNGLKIIHGNNEWTVSFNNSGNFSKSVSLNSGLNTIKVQVTNGTDTVTKTLDITYGSGPIIVVNSPLDRQMVYRDTITVTGTVINTESNRLFINGETVSFNTTDGSFAKTLTLKRFYNFIEIRAYNGSLSTVKFLEVWYNGNPSITVTSHAYGVTVDAADIILEGNIVPGDWWEIESFTINGTDNTSKIEDGKFRSFPVILQPGENLINFTLATMAQVTPNGNIPSKTVSKTLKIICKGGPSLNISSPIDGSTVYSNTVTIRGSLTGADFDSLTVAGKSVPISSNGSFEQTVSLKSGKNEIQLAATYGASTITKTLTLYYNSVVKVGTKFVTEVKDGDEVKAFDSSVKIKLVKGSLGMNTTSVLTVEDPSDLDALPKQSALIGPLARLRWEGHKPVKPYKITLQYDNVVVENQSHKVSVFYYDSGEDKWQVLGGVVDSKSRTISIDTDKEGYFVAAMYFRTFDDLVSHWALRDIEFLVARGAVEGNTGNRFMPDNNITRAEFVTFLVNALGMQPYKPDRASYSDVSDTHWGFKYIEAALRAGLVSGVSHNQFAPDRYITREEAAVILARAGNLKTLKDQEVTKMFSSFSDAALVSLWAKNELAAAIKSKLLSGSGNGTISPRKNTTRAQAAAMIARLTEVVNKTKK